MATFNRKKFFEGFRNRIDSTIEQEQVEGLTFLLDQMEADPLWKDIRHIAYALATAGHETAWSFQPVEEGYYLGSATRVKNFQKTLRYYPYFGRGYVQLTWETKKIPNYSKASKALGVDFVKSPHLVMVPKNAYKIMTLGMFQGWFTTKKLSDYISGSKCDYKNARKTINGLDKAALIAGYAAQFEQILKASKISDEGGIISATDRSPDIPPTSIEIDKPQAPSSSDVIENPVEVTQTNEEQTLTGKEIIEVTSKNEQDVNVPAQVSSTTYQGVGFIGAIKKDFAVVGGGNLSFQTLQEYATSASGWPPWVISIITKLATVVIIVGGVWLLFRLGHYLIWKIGDLQRMKVEANINADPKKKNIEWT